MLSQRHKVLLLLLDFIFVASSLHIFFWLRMNQDPFGVLLESSGFWFLVLSAVTVQYIIGLYDFDFQKGSRQLMRKSLAALAFLISLILLVSYILAKERTGLFGRGVLLPSFIFFQGINYLCRLGFYRWVRASLENAKVLVLGLRRLEPLLKKDLQTIPFSEKRDWRDIENLNALQLRELIKKENYRSMVLAVPSRELSDDYVRELIDLKMQGLQVESLTDFYESQLRRIPVNFVEPNWFLTTEGFGYYINAMERRLKRIVDLAISSVILLLTFPLIMVSAILTRLESSGEIFYSQIRTGRFNKPFRIYKLRTMRIDAESQGPQWAAKKDHRVTFFGKFFRKTRIDELPQLYNIFKGEMSFVGPRPERPEFDKTLALEIPYYELRYSVPPGLTGWAQVLYPYGASVEDSRQKLQFDLYYIKNFSLLLDMTIILKTLSVVFGGRGR